jgi:hypothetical protein
MPFLQEPEDEEDEEAMERYHRLRQDWPEEVVFHFGDLVDLYKEQALKDPRIKDFIEKLKEFVE